MKKRILSMLLALVMLISLLPQTTLRAHAEVYSGTCGAEGDRSNLTWTLDTDTGVLTISGIGKMYDEPNNSHAPWYPYRSSIRTLQLETGVTSIGSRAFASCSSLMSVIIPDSVTSIGISAFERCSSLMSVTIPDRVTFIGAEAFQDCVSITNVTIPNSVNQIGLRAFQGCSSLTSVAIGGGVTEIDTSTFSGCSSLTSVTIPDSVKKIGNSAFYGCSSLTNVTIPGNVTIIGMYAFEYCSSLTSVTIPDSVTSIGRLAFCGCSLLKTINVSSANSNYSSLDGVLFNKDRTELIQCPPGGKSGIYAIPRSVTSIGEWAFSYCSSLTSVTIPGSVTSIGQSAFYNCNSLPSITIPDSVTNIGRFAFCCGSVLEAINVSSGNSDYSSLDGVLFNKNKTELIQYPTGKPGFYEIPDSVTCIGYAFQGCSSITSVTFPDSVTSIYGIAFYKCSSLKSISILNPACEILSGARTLGDPGITTIYGYENSTAEEYANKYGYQFQAIDSGSVPAGNGFYGVGTSTDKIILFFYDRNSIEALTDVHFTVLKDGKEISKDTASEGVAELDLPNGEYTVNVIKDGYMTQSITRELQRGSVEIFGLTAAANIPTLYSIDLRYNNAHHDILQEKYVLPETDQTAFTLAAIAGYKENAQIKEYWLVQNGRVLRKSGSGLFENLKATDFTTENSIYLVAIGSDGVKGPYVKTNLIIQDNALVQSGGGTSAGIAFKDGIKFTIDSDIPLLGGMEFSLNLADLPVYLEIDEDKIKAGVNVFSADTDDGTGGVFKDDTTWKGFKNAVASKQDPLKYLQKMSGEKTVLQMAKGSDICVGSKGKLDFDIWGYLEGSVSSGDVTGTITVLLNSTISRDYQQIAFGVPIVITLSLEGKLEGSIDTETNVKNFGDLSLSGKISPSVTIGAGAGPGFSGVASLTVNGSGTLGGDYTFDKEVGNSFRSYLKAKVYIKLKLLFAEWEKSIAERTYVLYDSTGKRSLSIPEAAEDAMDIQNYSIADRSYLQTTSKWLGKTETRSPEQELKVLQSSIYGDTHMQLVKTQNHNVMFFLTDDAERSDVNRTKLVYSFYNEATGWSVPTAVEDDGTADFVPAAVTDGKKIYITWVDLKHEIQDGETDASFIAATGEIKLAEFDPSTGSVTIQRLTDNSCLDTAPVITLRNGYPSVAWIESTSNNILGNDDQNQMFLYDGATGKVKQILYNIPNIIEDAILTSDSEIYVACLIDPDGDYFTADDRNLVLYDSEGRLVRQLTEEASVSDLSVNQGELTWYQDGYLYCIEDVEADVTAFHDLQQSINGTYKIIEAADKTYVLFTGNVADETNQLTDIELFAYVYDNSISQWSGDVQISKIGKTITDFVGFTDTADKLQIVLNASDITEEDDALSESASLYSLIPGMSSELSLQSFEYEDAKKSEAGFAVPFTAIVKNNGFATSDKYAVELLRENKIAASVAFSEAIGVGETKAISGTLILGDIPCENTKYTVRVNCENDSDMNNNESEIVIAKRSIGVTITSTNILEDKYVVGVTVSNDGLFDVETTLKATLDSPSGELINSLPVSLSAGEQKQFVLTVDANDYSFDSLTRCVHIFVESDEACSVFFVLYKHQSVQVECPFEDVEKGAYYYDAVLWAVSADPQITSGTSETTFSPNATCTRAQVVTFLWRAKGCPEPTKTDNPFTDVKNGAYYYKAVLWAVENEITSGTSKTAFSPNAGCTRAQVVTFLWRAEGKPQPTSTNNPFTDVTGGYYYDAVLWAVENKITSGTSATRFSPNATCTRGQVVTFLYRDLANE